MIFPLSVSLSVDLLPQVRLCSLASTEELGPAQVQFLKQLESRFKLSYERGLQPPLGCRRATIWLNTAPGSGGGLGKDTPSPRPVTPPSARRTVAIPEVGGLHHRYDPVAA